MAQRADSVNVVAAIPVLVCNTNVLIPSLAQILGQLPSYGRSQFILSQVRFLVPCSGVQADRKKRFLV